MKTKKTQLLLSTLLAGATISAFATPAFAQEADDVVTVTGTRIIAPGIVSSSPITTIGTEELDLKQTIEVETLFRDLPITVPGDGQNVNNGTSGIATINLRALGSQRTLTMIDGKRLTPYDINGQVDTQTIPVNLIERVDIITGGASAVYGSDAMAGAVNFIMKDDYEGVTVDAKAGFDKDGKARKYNVSALLGSNFADDRGNAVISLNFGKRNPLLLGEREEGLFGISTVNGPNAGGVPASPDANCSGPNTTAFSTGVGSTTTIPTTLDLPDGSLQFQNDGTMAERCSRFNFNPFNYYQTPQERYNLAGLAHFDINDNIEAYTRINYSNITVRQQVAPSGIFGLQLDIPLQNPFLSTSARNSIIGNVNDFLASDPMLTLADAGVTDLNGNGIFDDQDSINTPVRRRTLELGTRSSNYDQDAFNFIGGIRGDIFDYGWNYDLSYQHGQTSAVEVRAGYTNVANIATAVNTVSATQCETPGGSITNGCVPIDLFGPFGNITEEAAAYSSATGILKKNYTQDIVAGSISGPAEALKMPWAENPTQLAFGAEYRKETGETIPDECLKLAPASCLGGAGGNILPISSSFDVFEFFGEAIVPLVDNASFAKSMNLELGFRHANYDPAGGADTWKAGLNWEVNDDFRVRVMQQQAVRAPNVGELGAPVTTGLDSADFDPCSSGNPNPISAETAALCVSTGVLANRVGLVNDIVSGQINVFAGTDLANLPAPETAKTFTAGFVWQPSFTSALERPTLSVDYYNIRIDDYISEFRPQEILDDCYFQGNTTSCSKITRINGTLATTGSGVAAFTTNLDFLKTEGIDIAASAGYDLGDMGGLNLSMYAAYLLSRESQSSAATGVIDCLGKFGNDCSPYPKLSTNTRLTWDKDAITASLLWRRLGGVEIQDKQKGNTFDGFEKIGAYNYFDLTASYTYEEDYTFTVGVRNLFDKSAPIVGNNAGSTAFNSGNTFPSTYDIIGRYITMGVRAEF